MLGAVKGATLKWSRTAFFHNIPEYVSLNYLSPIVMDPVLELLLKLGFRPFRHVSVCLKTSATKLIFIYSSCLCSPHLSRCLI